MSDNPWANLFGWLGIGAVLVGAGGAVFDPKNARTYGAVGLVGFVSMFGGIFASMSSPQGTGLLSSAAGANPIPPSSTSSAAPAPTSGIRYGGRR